MKKHIPVIFFCIVLIIMVIPAAAGANTLHVGKHQTYTSIQAAINAASDGDTIEVEAGRYNERITINKAITLNGATAGESKKGYNVPGNYNYLENKESIIAPQDTQNNPVVTIEKGGVTFDGFIVSMTVAGSYPVYAPTELVRMVAGGNLNDVRIQNNVIGPNTNVTSQNGNAGRMGITVSKHSPGTGDNNVYNLKILNNKIFDAKGDGCGILMIGARNTSTSPPSLQNQFKGAVIDNNEITGNHRSGIDFSGGVQGGPNEADHIKITNNIISNNGWNSTVDKDDIKWGNGIVLLRMTNQNETLPWASRYIDIEGNEFTNNEKNAVYIGPITRDVTIRNNIITDNGDGDYQSNHGYSIWDGIRIDLDEEYQVRERQRVNQLPVTENIYDYLTNVVIDENTISGNGGFGLQVIRTPAKGAVDARKNWWGAQSGPLNPASNPSGGGDKVSTNVRFSPWYANAGKTQTKSLAGGTDYSLYVGPGNFTTIQEAINAAQPGDTIRVAPGTYDERVVINKSVTLLGATSGISKKDYAVPEFYAYNTGTESIIIPTADENEAVVRIVTSPMTLDGFIIANTHANQYPAMAYPNTHLIAFSNMSHNYTEVRIENNVIGPNTNIQSTGSQDGTKGRAGIALYGPVSKTAWNITIARNRIFDAKGDGCGIMLLGSQNTSTSSGLAAKYLGSTIDNNTITGNHRSGIELSGDVQGSSATTGHFRITSNNISDNGWGNEQNDKDVLKYGNGIVLIRTKSDAFSYYNPFATGIRYVDIDNNRITGNEKNGIYIGPVSRDINITNNVIWDNGAGTGGYQLWDGVQVDLDERYHLPPQQNLGFLDRIFLKDNEITENGDYGVQVINTPTRGSIDARNNWWGDASGPKESKNPSGTANRVSANVAFSPWYKNQQKTSTSSTFQKPIASFSVNPVQAMKGETFLFDASQSAALSNTSIQSYIWDFGDGNTSSASGNPLTSHNFQSPKVHTITLTVKDFNSMTNQTTRDVTVIAKKESVALTFNGTTVSGTTGAQKITFDSEKVNGTMSNTTKEVKIKDPGNGWDEIVVTGNTTGGSGQPVTVQNITEVVLKSKPSITQLETTTSDGKAGPGDVTTSIQLSLKEFANAPLQVEVSQGANASVSNAFQLAAGSGNNVDVAYTMTIKGSSLINSNVSSPSGSVILNMSVSEDWINAHGGITAIKVIRYTDDGNTRQVLETTYSFTDNGAPKMCYFTVISPGCSVFGVTAISAIPQTVQQQAGYPSYYSGSSSASSSDGSSSTPGQKTVEKKTEQLAPQETEEVTPVATKSPEPRERRSHFLNLESEGIPLYDQVVTVISGSEHSPAGIFKDILAFIVSNVIAITSIIIMSVACAFAIIWYGDRKRYWL